MGINIIVAFSSKNFGIGKDGKLPWNIQKDLVHFSQITKNSTVVMGHNTWKSIPNDKKPLKNRFNVVVSSKTNLFDENNINNGVIVIHPDYLDNYIDSLLSNGDVFIIGGEKLYEKYMGVADNIYATLVDKHYECDTFFPIEKFRKYEIDTYSEAEYSEEEQCNYRFIKYKKSENGKINNESQYLNLMKNILENGKNRPDRTGVSTRSLFGTSMVFDISSSIPILTTKQVGWKTILRELLWVLSGSSDSKELERKKVTIWRDNTSIEFLKNRGLDYKAGITGPLYGHNFRHFSAPFIPGKTNYQGEGIDQMANLIESLKKDKYSRRHMLTTFDPSTVHQAVLYPCHANILNYFVEQDDIDKDKYYLDCCVYNRSQDVLLGVPFNIGSYAMLSYIVANLTDMHPRKLTFFMGDTHIYKNHIDACFLQTQRNPLPSPIFKVHDIKNLKLEEISEEKFELVGYLSHPKISAPMAI